MFGGQMTIINELRCVACDEELSDDEASHKYPNGDFIDLCTECHKHIYDDDGIDNDD